jgi:hypothetical protein
MRAAAFAFKGSLLKASFHLSCLNFSRGSQHAATFASKGSLLKASFHL